MTQTTSTLSPHNWKSILRHDLPASLIVFLVALPLCMGIAIASGAPPAAGLFTGIIGGLVVGWISGCQLQVSGPAAGLTVIVWEIIQEHGLAGLAVITLLGGLIQFVAGLARVGIWFRAVSPAVVQGMLSGIGILILASQFHVMVDDQPRDSGIANLLSIPESIWKGLVPMDGTTHHLAAAVGVGAILILLFWKALVPGKLKLLPAPIVAVVLAAVVTSLATWQIQLVQVPDNLVDSIGGLSAQSWDMLSQGSIWIGAFTIALVASAETLLCATAVDQMHTGQRTNYNRELTAQGVGNILCGGVGALPMTGVIVRSSVNLGAGAQSRASAIFHGAWLLLLVALLPGLLRTIPLASLAAVLVYTGAKLVNWRAIRELWKVDVAEGVICVTTMSMIVVFDLLTGVLAGVALAAVKLLYRISRLHIQTQVVTGQVHLRLHGAATFLALPKLAAALESIPSATELHVHLEQLSYLDHACLELFNKWKHRHEASGGKLVIDWQDLADTFDRSKGLAARGDAPAAPSLRKVS
jgi:MFS superfamily sulfate permease-like transporter